VGIIDSSVALEASSMTSSSIALSSSDARTTIRFGETNFLDFLSLGGGDMDDDDRFLFSGLGRARRR